MYHSGRTCLDCNSIFYSRFQFYNHKKRNKCDPTMKKAIENTDEEKPQKRRRLPVDESPYVELHPSSDGEKHFYNSLPMLLNMVIKNCHDPSAISSVLEADIGFRKWASEIVSFANEHSNFTTGQINGRMKNVKTIQLQDAQNDEALVKLVAACYERIQTGPQKFQWKMSMEDIDHQIKVNMASVKALEEMKEIRKLIPSKIVCEYVAKNLVVPTVQQPPVLFSFGAPESASQLLDDTIQLPEEEDSKEEEKKKTSLFGFWYKK